MTNIFVGNLDFFHSRRPASDIIRGVRSSQNSHDRQ